MRAEGRGLSLRTRLVGLLALVGVLPLAAATAVELRGARTAQQEAGERLLESCADHLVSELEAFHRQYAALAHRAARYPDVVRFAAGDASAAPHAASVLEVAAQSDGNLRGLALFDPEGTIRLGTERPLLGRSYAFRDYFQQARAGRSNVSDVYLAVPEVDAVPSIAYAEPIREGERVLGVLALYVRAQAFWDAVRAGNGRAGEGSFSVVYDRHGVRIAHSFAGGELFRPCAALDPAAVEALVVERRFGDRTRALLETPLSVPEEAARVAHPGLPPVFRGWSPANQAWNLVVTRRLRAVPWTVFFQLPEAALLAPADRLVRETVAVALLIVAGSLLLGLIAAGWVSRPLRGLIAAAEALRRGAPARVESSDGAGELGLLVARWNEMVDALATDRDLLERRVAERTEALGAARAALEGQNGVLEERNAELEGVRSREGATAEALTALVGAGDPLEGLAAALVSLARVLDLPLAVYWRVEGDPPTLVPRGGRGAAGLPPLPLVGAAADSFRERRSVLIDPLPDEGLELRYDAALVQAPIRSLALVPLCAGAGDPQGLVGVGSMGRLPEGTLTLLEGLAAPLSLALARAELTEEAASAHADLRRQAAELEARAEALARQGRELDLFFSVSVDLFTVVDAEGRFVRTNPAWERTLGYPAAELLGRRFMELVHPEDQVRTQDAMAGLLRGELVKGFENRYLNREGDVRWLRWSAAPVLDLGLVFASARDVSDERQAEARLREQTLELRAQGEELRQHQLALEQKNRELEQASRFKSEFLANMSHELRTPLNAVIGFSDLLLSDSVHPLAPEQRRRVEDVLLSGRHLLELINDILDLVKVESGRMTLNLEPVAPEAAVAAALGVVEGAAAAKRVTLTSCVSAPRPVLADPGRLRQVLLNLLGNAVKFSPAGARVEVAADEVQGLVRFAVVDHGPGIDPDLRPRLFQPFVQGESPLHKTEHGTGLGLAISRRLVEAHGGEIGVEATPGGGATFSFTIPLSAPGQAPVRRTTEAVAVPGALGAPRGSSRVPVPAAGPPPRSPGPAPLLVVEDDPAARRLLAGWLDPAEWAVTWAADPDTALREAERVRPAAVVLDVILGEEDGLALLTALKRHPGLAGTPVVVTSILDERQRGLALGAADWLVKPLDGGTLLRRLRELVPVPPLLLLIDDDPRVEQVLRGVLPGDEFRLEAVPSGLLGLERARDGAHERPGLILIDLVLPDTTGLAVARALADDARTADIPRVVLTAADLAPAERDRLRSCVRAIAEKGDLTREALLGTLRRALGRASDPPAPGSGPVLVVDDHDLNRELVRAILAGEGYAVTEAADGGEALAAARRARPALVLMDLAMPRLDGFAALRGLRADPELRAIPVLALTALAMRSDERRAREAGFDGYLTKPIDREALVEAVRSFLPGRGA